MNELSLVGMKLPHVKYKENFDVSSEASSASSSFLFLKILPINKKLRRLFREIMFNVVHFINIQTRTHVQYTHAHCVPGTGAQRSKWFTKHVEHSAVVEYYL
jgi:diadenosine tetraphosphate (Ap4A) HIT family hydrolase